MSIHLVSNTMQFNIFTGRNEVLAKVMSLHLSVILLTGGGLPGPQGGVPDQEPPSEQAGPPEQAGAPLGLGRYPQTRQEPPGPGRKPPEAGRNPPRPDPPRTRPPSPRPDPPGPNPPPPLRDQTPRPGTADSGIRSTFGRYASYWNAFVFSTVNEILRTIKTVSIYF